MKKMASENEDRDDWISKLYKNSMSFSDSTSSFIYNTSGKSNDKNPMYKFGCRVNDFVGSDQTKYKNIHISGETVVTIDDQKYTGKELKNIIEEHKLQKSEKNKIRVCVFCKSETTTGIEHKYPDGESVTICSGCIYHSLSSGK